ncbi:MAG TPA: hypothetical protein VHD83_28680, partial [Puia sp.]|nr:hypothetical protein [Puia sp.]
MNIAGTITTLEEFNNLVEGIRGRRAYTQAFGLPYRSEFYRGQVDAGWTITPGLSRDLKAGDQVREAETLVIEHFKARIQAENYLHKIFLHANP